MNTPWYFHHAFMTSERATATPCLPRRSPKGQPVGLALTPYKVAAFTLGPGEHETLCVPSKNGVSLSQSLGELLQSSLAALQSQMLWGSSSQYQNLQLGAGAGVVCAEAENFHCCGRISVNYSLVCGSPTQGGFDYVDSVPLLLSCWVSSLYLSM